MIGVKITETNKENGCEHKFPYEWTLNNVIFNKDKGKVFSCFACGGGSSLGYKLAGFDVIVCNDIDKKMMELYVENNHPQYTYLCDIRDMVEDDNLPEELYHLDILDGSPPCSSFSTSGNRHRDWGKEKKFREGQKTQVLDTLFFDFIALAKKLQPKIVIAENVKGLMLGKALTYVNDILRDFDDAGYVVKHFLLCAENMGVPQKRERVFFICVRKDLAKKCMRLKGLFGSELAIDMDFNETPIAYSEFADNDGKPLTKKILTLWENIQDGDTDLSNVCVRLFNQVSYLSSHIIYDDKVSPTLTSHVDSLIPRRKPKYTSEREACLIQSFPLDYNFKKCNPHYVLGMSVPPVMMANVASCVYEQLLKKNK